MTNEEMAEEYVDTLLDKDDPELDKLIDENLGDLELNKKQAGTLLGIIKGVGICSFLAGLKAGKDMNVSTEWHKVADGDLPKEENHYWSKIVLFQTNKGDSYVGFFDYADKAWYEKSTDDVIFGVIAWCEIPKYTEE